MGRVVPGALDPFTALFGGFALVVLGAHGATFLAWKTDGAVSARSRALARRSWIAAIAVGSFASIVLALRLPSFFATFAARPWLWPLPLAALFAAFTARRSLGAAQELRAFLASSTFIAAMLLASAGTLYPVILRSTLDDAYTLDAGRTAAGPHALAAGVAILASALLLAAGYFAYLFRTFRGKRSADHS
jgi:cytochrome d ubiquinol oxidase subunit II